MIDRTAVIDKTADIADGVSIGAYSVIEPGVVIGKGTVIGPHCVIHKGTHIGQNNRISTHVVLGGDPQDKAYDGRPTELIIGDNNVIREFSTIHKGSVHTGKTTVGNHNFIMAYCHFGHDCNIGNHIVIANSVMGGGHCRIDDYANLGGGVGIHQFCRIGRLAMVGGMSRITKNILPFSMCEGSPVSLSGANTIGLKRFGMSQEDIRLIRSVFSRLFFQDGLFTDRLQKLKKEAASSELTEELIEFIESSDRGIAGRK